VVLCGTIELHPAMSEPHPAAASTVASSSDVLGVDLPPKPASTLKARISSQLPLHPGRKVAFRTPSDKTVKSSVTPPTGEGDGYEEGAWILAVVKRSGKCVTV
jgi:hypothetical protein